MSGTIGITVAEARGFTAVSADIDQLAVVMGVASGLAGMSSFYLSGSAARTAVGYGDAVDTLCQIIEQRLPTGNGRKFPAAIYGTETGTAGSYGTIDVSLVEGTVIPANDSALEPYGTYESGVRIVDDGNAGAGGVLGVAGILYQYTLNNGRKWSKTMALSTDYAITIPNSNVRFQLTPPSAQQAALVTYVNAIRTATLAHFPYTTGTVHGAADSTSDDGVGSACTNVATGITLTGQLITAFGLHFARGSTVHLTADVTTSLAAATAAQAVAVASGAAQDLMTVALLLETALETHEANETYHTAADAVNVVSATQPTRGTLFTNDAWFTRTFGPAPGSDDIDDAFAALVNGDASTVDFGILVCDWDMTAALAARVTAGLTALAGVGKRVTAIVRTRIPEYETDETEAEWLADVAADYADFDDSRVCVRAGYGLVTDAMTGRAYLRSTLQQFSADVVRVGLGGWPCAPADKGTGLAGEPNVTLIDDDGATVGHDEGPRGAVTGLSDDTLDNRFSCEQRLPDVSVRESVFNTFPWVMYAEDEQIRSLMARMIANSMERLAVRTSIPALGGAAFYTRTSTLATTGLLSPEARKGIQGPIYNALSSKFAGLIGNAKDAAIDTGLVQVSQTVTVASGGRIGVSVTLAPRIAGFVVNLAITLTFQE